MSVYDEKDDNEVKKLIHRELGCTKSQLEGLK